MRRRLGRLAATTAAALALSVMIATPADARRNLGGTLPEGTTCVQPGGVVLGDPASSTAPCVCYSNESGTFRNLGRSAEECPRGADRAKIDRNVGG
jgi:hypothetical protein